MLRTPPGHWHTEFIATTSEAGDVAVHTAWAGLRQARRGYP